MNTNYIKTERSLDDIENSILSLMMKGSKSQEVNYEQHSPASSIHNPVQPLFSLSPHIWTERMDSALLYCYQAAAKNQPPGPVNWGSVAFQVGSHVNATSCEHRMNELRQLNRDWTEQQSVQLMELVEEKAKWPDICHIFQKTATQCAQHLQHFFVHRPSHPVWTPELNGRLLVTFRYGAMTDSEMQQLATSLHPQLNALEAKLQFYKLCSHYKISPKDMAAKMEKKYRNIGDGSKDFEETAKPTPVVDITAITEKPQPRTTTQPGQQQHPVTQSAEKHQDVKPSGKMFKWTPALFVRLEQACAKYPGEHVPDRASWAAALARHVGSGVTPEQCHLKWKTCIAKWTSILDMQLVDLMLLHGPQWSLFAKDFKRNACELGYRYSAKCLTVQHWTKEEDAELSRLLVLSTPWEEIAAQLKRDVLSCKYRRCLSLYRVKVAKESIKKRPGPLSSTRSIWTLDLDEKLINARLSRMQWSDVALAVGLTKMQCMAHYQYICAQLKDWSENEVETLQRLVEQDEPWESIASQLNYDVLLCKFRYCMIKNTHCAPLSKVAANPNNKERFEWNFENDHKLKAAVKKHAPDLMLSGKWPQIAKEMGLSKSQCISRYEYLDRTYPDYLHSEKVTADIVVPLFTKGKRRREIAERTNRKSTRVNANSSIVDHEDVHAEVEAAELSQKKHTGLVKQSRSKLSVSPSKGTANTNAMPQHRLLDSAMFAGISSVQSPSAATASTSVGKPSVNSAVENAVAYQKAKLSESLKSTTIAVNDDAADTVSVTSSDLQSQSDLSCGEDEEDEEKECDPTAEKEQRQKQVEQQEEGDSDSLVSESDLDDEFLAEESETESGSEQSNVRGSVFESSSVSGDDHSISCDSDDRGFDDLGGESASEVGDLASNGDELDSASESDEDHQNITYSRHQRHDHKEENEEDRRSADDVSTRSHHSSIASDGGTSDLQSAEEEQNGSDNEW